METPESSWSPPGEIDLASLQLLEGLRARSPEAFAYLYQQTVAQVYRYHLARSGDVIEAQDRTAESFRTALKWITSYRPQKASLPAWLLGIARHKQMDALRAARGSFSPPEADPGEQAAWTLQALQAAHALRKLSPEKADALALHFFGGLDLAETGQALGRSAANAQKRIRAALEDFKEQAVDFSPVGIEDWSVLSERLAALAAGIHPDPAFVTRLGDALKREPHVRQWAWLEERGYRLRSLFTPRALTWIAILALIAVGLTASLTFIPPSPPNPPLPPVQPTEENILSAPNSSGGYLVPPPLATCQDWRERFANGLKLDVELVPMVYIRNRGGYGSDAYGTGCQLKASGDGTSFVSSQAMVDRASAIIQAESGFTTLISGGGLPYILQPSPDQDWYGQGAFFSNQELSAILVVSWRPTAAAEGLCSPGMAETQCQLHPADKLFNLSLLLGADLFHPVVGQFIERWEQGDNSATALISTRLLSRFPDVAALDRLAGIDRDKVPHPGISWQVVENTGESARVELTVWDGPPADPGTHRLTSLQMILRPTVSPDSSGITKDAWRIEDLIHGVFFSPSEDTLVLADEHGQVYLLDLNTLTRRNLTPRGVYSPDPTLDLVSQSTTHAWLSPDAQQLLVSGPRGAWLISLQKRSALRIADPLAQAAWSPDSRHIVFTGTKQPAALLLYTLGTGGGTHPLAQLEQAALDLAWSPRGDWIAAADQAAPPVHQGNSWSADLHLWLIQPASGQTTHLARMDHVPYYSPLNRLLAWTTDQGEIWLLPAQTAVHLADNSLRPLAARPVNNQNIPMQTIFQTVQSSLLGISTQWFGQPSIQLLSPDGQHLAGGVLTPEGEIDYLGVKEIDINHGSYSDSYTWSHSISGVQTMAYTLEGGSLIAARGVNHLGALWRFNAASGDGEKIVDQAAYLGLLSQLQKNSLRLAPAVQKSHRPDPAPGKPWTKWTLELAHKLSFQFPPDWNAQTRLDVNQGLVTLGNVDFSSGYGWASLDRGDLMIEMYLYDLSRDEAGKQWLAEVQADRSGAWEQFSVAGRTAYRMAHQYQGRSPQRILVPLGENLMLQIFKYPFVSDQDPLFEGILESIEIPAPEEK